MNRKCIFDNIRESGKGWTGDCYFGDISTAITHAKNIATEKSEKFEFEFNGVTVIVSQHSPPELILRDWNRAMSGYIDKQVGPHPALELTQSEIAEDARIEAENEARRKKQRKEYEAKEKVKRDSLTNRLASAPEFSADMKAWESYRESNGDPYGACVVRYAEVWGRLMQMDIANGKSLEDIASATSHEADIEGITGFMYGCAVGMLAKSWVHGEELRRWHNKDVQIGDEGDKANESGGVLNPALLCLGK